VPVDLNGDSIEEMLITYANNYTIARNQRFEVVSSSVAFDRRTLRYVVPGASGPSQLWVTYDRHDTAFLYKLWDGPEFALANGPKNPTSGYWDGEVTEVQLCDINADSRVEAIGLVRVGFARRPRGVVAWDWQSGTPLWDFAMGPYPMSLLLRDVDQDGKTEVLFGSVAPRNFNSDNGTDDSLAYAFCLNSDGTLRWQRLIGHYPQNVAVSWLHPKDTTDRRLLVCELGYPVPGFTLDSVFILDGLTGQVLNQAQYGKVNECFAVIQDLRGGSRIAVANNDDTLRVLDERLHLIHKCALNGYGCRAICAGRFTGARYDEIAIATANGQLLLFDPDLDLLHRREQSNVGALFAIRVKDRSRLMVARQAPSGTTWQLLEYRIVPVMGRPITVATLLVSILTLLTAFVVVLAYVRLRQTHDMRAVVRGLTGQAGVIELDNRNRLRRANPKGRELLRAAGASESTPLSGALMPLGSTSDERAAARELPLSLPSGQTVLARATPLKTGLLLTLEDISAVEYMKRVTSWAPVAQKLAHDIKNPLTAISLTLQRVEKAAGPGSQRYVDSMKDDIDRLKKMADGFMRLTKLEPPKLAPEDINEVVRQCAGRFEGVKPAGVEFRYDLAEHLPSVALDRDQMAVACSNVIENSISAMGDSGTLTVSTSLAGGGRLIAVSVRDTGKGIPERYVAKVFEPYFTLKAGGTGLGMSLTKRIIDDHKGTIRIDSKEGAGTTVTIELPVAGTGSA
jgi:signal transduction histidine kinase